MKAELNKLLLISRDDWDKVHEESGITYKKWSGYHFYNSKPWTRISGNETTNPGVDENGIPKKAWIAISESITKEEREGDEEHDPIIAEEYGFATIFESPDAEKPEQINKSVVLVNGKFFEDDITCPLSGWINTREIVDQDGVTRTYRTLALGFKQKTLDFWEEKVETPYILNGGMDDKEFEQILATVEEDYPEAAQWYLKFFPGTGDKKVKNAAKRRELYKKGTSVKAGVAVQQGTPAKAKANPWAKPTT